MLSASLSSSVRRQTAYLQPDDIQDYRGRPMSAATKPVNAVILDHHAHRPEPDLATSLVPAM
jgi:hypothetical protein